THARARAHTHSFLKHSCTHTHSYSRSKTCSCIPTHTHTHTHTRTHTEEHTHGQNLNVFRTDFITAMKLPDSAQLGPDDFYVLSDPWRQEWEKGVQVPANVEAIPEPVVRLLPESSGGLSNNRQEREGDTQPPPTQLYSCYDLDDLDVAWLELVNQEFRQMALPELDELTMECVLVELESVCEEKMQQAIETEEGLGIEYDEDVVCDVCRSPEGEDGNEMVFCDKCNVCVHQACYGILKVPQGNWLCRTCALGVQPKCLLCPKRGGALKPTRSGTKWVHVSCALWIPEVSIGCPEKMEPITKVSHIPASRWALSCSLCREHTGTCIQCSMPSCIVAFHVTCAFDHGLEMRTILAENDEVRFKSFCLEHSCTASNSTERDQLEREKVSQRKQKLQELEDEFYRLVDPREVAENLGLPVSQVDFLYQFWKLKRKANFNRPLVTLKRDEVDNLAQQEQDVLYRRLKLFTHLRQDLERVRNLCYMVTRREKMKHTLCDLQEKIFHLQIQLLEEDMAGGLSKSFPLDNSLFDSWLAQSVQITADDMMSQWALGAQHGDKSGSLLSDQVGLHQQEAASPVLVVIPPPPPSPRRSSLQRLPPPLAAPPLTSQAMWAGKGKGPGGPPRPCTTTTFITTRPGALTWAGSVFTGSLSSPPASSPVVTVPDTGAILRGGAPRLRLPRQGKSRGRGVSGGGGIAGLESMDLPLTRKDTSLLDAAETDGYFSDGEQSDSDTRSGGRKLRLPQLHSGNEDLLRRSVLAS
uniref:Jade family PHD finger 2 n=1 Tax=Seriola dumerili TaxID=41447 RepID=A0A3B4VGM2_SERDU